MAKKKKINASKQMVPFAPAKSKKVKTAKAHSKPRGFVVKHRELISEENADVSFDPHIYRINPGDQQTFPWLSYIAPNFERYRFHSLRFEFVSRTPATQGGSVLLSIDYDPNDPPGQTFAQLAAREGAVDFNIWESGQCRANTASLHPGGIPKFVRTGSDTNGDIRLEDCGFFTFLASLQSGVLPNVGQLWVHYEVELLTPQLTTARQPPALEQMLILSLGGGDWTNITPVAFPGTFSLDFNSGANPPHQYQIESTTPDVKFPVGYQFDTHVYSAIQPLIAGTYLLDYTWMLDTQTRPTSNGVYRDHANICVEVSDDNGHSWQALSPLNNEGVSDTFTRFEVVQDNQISANTQIDSQRTARLVLNVAQAAIAIGRLYRLSYSTDFKSDAVYKWAFEFGKIIMRLLG
jgi:hypothetical protein